MQIDLSKYKKRLTLYTVIEIISDCKHINNIYNILRNTYRR